MKFGASSWPFQWDPPYENAIKRIADWNEFHEHMDEKKLREQAARCMDCGIPFCHTGQLVSGTIDAADSTEALKAIREEGRFPSARLFVSAVQFLVFVAMLQNFGGDWGQFFRKIVEFQRFLRFVIRTYLSVGCLQLR